MSYAEVTAWIVAGSAVAGSLFQYLSARKGRSKPTTTGNGNGPSKEWQALVAALQEELKNVRAECAAQVKRLTDERDQALQRVRDLDRMIEHGNWLFRNTSFGKELDRSQEDGAKEESV